jgi:hypothetical protein
VDERCAGEGARGAWRISRALPDSVELGPSETITEAATRGATVSTAAPDAEE